MHSYHQSPANPSLGVVEPPTDISTAAASPALDVRNSSKGKNPERSDQERILKTTVLINNLHCASCVSHAQRIVGGLHPPPLYISANILTHELTARHTANLHPQVICQELLNAGFELRSLTTEEEESSATQEPTPRNQLNQTKSTSRSSMSAPKKILELDFGDTGNDGWLEKATERLSASTGIPAHIAIPLRPYGSAGTNDRQKRKKHIENCDACKVEAVADKASSDGENPLKWDADKGRGPRLTKPVFHALRETKDRKGEQHRYPSNGDGPSEAPKYSRNQSTSGDPVRGLDLDTCQAGFREADNNVAGLPRGGDREQGGRRLDIDLGKDPRTLQPRRPEEYKASLGVGGMTCSACTGTVSSAIEEFSWVKSVNVNLLSNSASIVFEGPKSGIDKIMEKIQGLGYDCVLDECYLAETAEVGIPAQNARTQELGEFEATLSIGGMTCGACTAAVGRCLDEVPWVKSHSVNLLTNSAAVVFKGPKERIDEVVEKIEDLGYDCASTELTAVAGRTPHASDERPLKSPSSQLLSATLSIGGMTCAVCVGAISQGLETLSYVKTININLLTNSGVVVFEGEKHLDEIVEKVGDLGYDCKVEDCTEVRGGDGAHREDSEVDAERTMMIKIAGMFCEHCPPKVLGALRTAYPHLVAIDKAPTLNDPILRVTYSPKPPSFSIRDILSTIQSIDDNYKATIYHPPTIEERSRAMQRHEQYRLLIRLFLCIVIAIPTFLIGIVWMTLVPEWNSTRIYLEEPMWSGSVSRATWALLFLSTPVMFFAADVFHVRAIKEIRALWWRGSAVPLLRRFYRFGSMNLLISAGTTIAYISSIATLGVDATRKPVAGPFGMTTHFSTTYFDTVVFLTMFILLGRFLEAYSKAKTGDAVTMLGRLRPTQAILLCPSDTKEASSHKEEFQGPTEYIASNVSVDLLEAGDIVRITHGSSPPADGFVVSGTTEFDESSLTGESRLIVKTVGDKVFAGTVNKGKAISMKVTLVSGDSMLDQIVKIVREGQTKRAPVERLADILTGYFVPVITLLAIITFIVWFALGQSGAIPDGWRDVEAGGWAVWALGFAIAVFVVACPCGIGLAAPTALFVGSGLAAKYGILVKGGGEAFQEASGLDVIVFDKTGTLTEGGDPRVTDYDLLTSDNYCEKLIWGICYALEETSSHPIAKAILGLCEQQPRLQMHEADIEEIPGKGLKGIFSVKEESGMAQYEAVIGNENLMRSVRTLVRNTSRRHVEKWKREGKSVALLSIKRLSDHGIFDSDRHMLAAQFATTDNLRPEAAFVIKKLQQSGVAVWMLSGDNSTTATAVGALVGIPPTNIIAGVLPEEKARKIQYLQRTAPKRGAPRGEPPSGARAYVESQANPSISPNRAIVAMVGDGINDSPALTMADVGIAIGSGSDVAISSAKFVLVSSDLRALLTLTTLSRAVFRRVKFNFAWALVYNMAMLPVAAGVLYPLRGHVRLDPVWASLAMALSSVSVVCSSLLLRSGLPFVGFRPAKGIPAE